MAFDFDNVSAQIKEFKFDCSNQITNVTQKVENNYQALTKIHEVNQMLGYMTEYTNISNMIDEKLLEGPVLSSTIKKIEHLKDSYQSPTNDTKTMRLNNNIFTESTKDHEFQDHSNISPRQPIYNQSASRVTPLELMKPPKTAGDV